MGLDEELRNGILRMVDWLGAGAQNWHYARYYGYYVRDSVLFIYLFNLFKFCCEARPQFLLRDSIFFKS